MLVETAAGCWKLSLSPFPPSAICNEKKNDGQAFMLLFCELIGARLWRMTF